MEAIGKHGDEPNHDGGERSGESLLRRNREY